MKLTVTKKAITSLTVIALLSTFTLLNLKYDSQKKNDNDNISKVTITISNEELTCLTKNIYWESKNQSVTGQIAVAHVTLNRTKEEEFPKSICGVVKQKIGDVCQFSWVCSSIIKNKPHDPVLFAKAQDVATQAVLLHNQGYDITNGALFFHAKYVNPGFFKGLTKVVEIDDHVFYKRKT